jgi:HEAT repeat protein
MILNIVLLVGVVLGAGAVEESELLAVLRSEVAVPEKTAACQALRIHGTVKSIPELAALLTDEHLGHAARFALEGMPYPEAGDALRAALNESIGLLRVGLVDSLGWRGEKASETLLLPLLSDGDVLTAVAAATALSRIGGEKAIAALIAASKNTNPHIQGAAYEALLRCAERLAAKDAIVRAGELYRDIFKSPSSTFIRMAAWRGWMLVDNRQRGNRIFEALRGDDEKLRRTATKLIREMNDEQLAGTLLKRWDALPVHAQLAVLDTHLQMGEALLPALRVASQSPYSEVRAAAWRALAVQCDVSMVPAVLQAAVQADNDEKEAARAALAQMSGAGVQQALIDHTTQAGNLPDIPLILALGERGDSTAVPALLSNAHSDEASVRLAALKSLRLLADADTLQPLLQITAASVSKSERTAALAALYAALRRCPNMAHAGREVIAKLQDFSTEERINVLPGLARLGTPEAMTELRKAAHDEDKELRRESFRVLAQWPTAAAVPQLFESVRSASDLSMRVLALRGGITVTRGEPDPVKRLALLDEALALSERSEERKMILSELSRIPLPGAADRATTCLKDPELLDEAGMAAILIAESLAAESPDLADETARKILEYVSDPALVSRARTLRTVPATEEP